MQHILEQRQAKEAKRIADQKKAFQQFIAKPEIKLVMSLIPGGENKETLPLLLESAFDAGANVGTGMVVTEMIETIFKKELGPR